MEEKDIKDVDIMKALSYCNYIERSVSFRDNKNNNIDYIAYKRLLDHVSFDDIKRCERLLHNRFEKKCRLYKIVMYMLMSYPVCYFCTFTLDDDSVDLSLRYLRNKLTTFMNALETTYLGNVDYGDKNGRLHFHCIIAQNDIVVNKDNLKWPFGYYDIKVINIDSNGYKKLASYIYKLVNHASKVTTKNRIITPRGFYNVNRFLKNKSDMEYDYLLFLDKIDNETIDNIVK